MDAAVDRLLAEVRQHWVSVVAATSFSVFVIVYVGAHGLPGSVQTVALLTVVGLACACRTNVKRFARGLVVDWAPFFILLSVYELLWARADGFLTANVHSFPQINIDTWLGHGASLTTRLQGLLWKGSPHWWDYLCLLLYFSHFVMTTAVAGVLWLRSPATFRRYRALVVMLCSMALATYALYPAAPPWWAAAHKLSSPLTRTVIPTLGATPSPAHGAPSAVSQLGNSVAALPSMHAALPMLLVLFFWRRSRRLRAVFLAYAFAMAFMLVYTGEHSTFDIALGWAYAGIAFAVVTWLRNRRGARDGRQHGSRTIPVAPTPLPAHRDPPAVAARAATAPVGS